MSEPVDLCIHGDIARPDGSLLRGGWVAVSGGLIVSVGDEPVPANETVDASGSLILPGFVDAHVHTRSSTEEGIGNTTRCAAAGGTTTVIDMPFDRPERPVNSADRLRAKIEDIGREAIVNVGLYVTFPPEGDLSIIGEMAALGAAGFKVSTIEVHPVRFPRIPDGRLYEAFQEIARTDLPVAAHQENQDIVDRLTARARDAGLSDPIQHALTRPPVAETEAAGRLLEIAYWAGARLHMVHGTVARTFELIRFHRESGTRATGETCVQYLLLDRDELTRLGGRAKCNPPLRSAAEVEALWPLLADGQIDFVTSDHSPYPLSVKDTDHIFDAWAGLPGAQLFGSLLYSEGVAKGRISLARFVEVTSARPAEVFGLPRKGRIEEGADADLVIVDPAAEYTIDESDLLNPVGWSPYHGRRVTGAITATYCGGRLVFDGRTVVGMPGHGRFVKPDAPAST